MAGPRATSSLLLHQVHDGIMIRVIVTRELPHQPLENRQRLETPPHECADQPLTGKTTPPLLGDGIQYITDLRLELLHAVAPL